MSHLAPSRTQPCCCCLCPRGWTTMLSAPGFNPGLLLLPCGEAQERQGPSPPSSAPPTPPSPFIHPPQPSLGTVASAPGGYPTPPPRGSISWVPGPGWKWVIAPAFRLGGSPHPAVVGEKYFTPVHPCTDLCQGLYKSKWVFCLGALPRDRKYASEADGST